MWDDDRIDNYYRGTYRYSHGYDPVDPYRRYEDWDEEDEDWYDEEEDEEEEDEDHMG